MQNRLFNSLPFYKSRNWEPKRRELGVEVRSVSPGVRRLRKNCLEFTASLGYLVNFRPDQPGLQCETPTLRCRNGGESLIVNGRARPGRQGTDFLDKGWPEETGLSPTESRGGWGFLERQTFEVIFSYTEFQSSLGYLRRKEKQAVEEGKEERGKATEIWEAWLLFVNQTAGSWEPETQASYREVGATVWISKKNF